MNIAPHVMERAAVMQAAWRTVVTNVVGMEWMLQHRQCGRIMVIGLNLAVGAKDLTGSILPATA